MTHHRPLVWARSDERPSTRGKDREAPANSLAGRLLRQARRTPGQWCLVAPQVYRLRWIASTDEGKAVMWLMRHGLVSIDYQPARWCSENVWIRAR